MAVLILSRPMSPEALAQSLRERGFPHPIHTELESCDPASVRWVIAWRLPKDLIARLPNLQMVFNSAAGVDRLLSSPGVTPALRIARVADPGQALELAQYVVHATLDHLRLAPRYRAQQLARDWSRHRAPVLGTPVLVLGLGQIGQAIARALAALGFHVTGWSRGPREVPGIVTVTGADGLAQALPRARVLVCALPLTPRTTGLIDAALLARLPRGALLVNIGRGGHVVEPDLIAALESGQLAAATIDVQAHEPLSPDDPLWSAPNLTLTPHVAGQIDPATVAAQFADEVERLQRGQPPRHPVDPMHGY